MSANVNDTDINVTGLTAGVQYSFTVIAVAGDDTTQSEMAQISHYASKMMSYIIAHGSIYNIFVLYLCSNFVIYICSYFFSWKYS